MTWVSCSIDGDPVPRGSHRDLPAWEASVSWHLRRALAGRPAIRGAVEVNMTFRLPAPKRTKVAQWPWHSKRPGVEKLGDIVLDALVGTEVITDRDQIGKLDVIKQYAEGGLCPGVVIFVGPATERRSNTRFPVDGAVI